jgi:hypothetical protein
MAVLFEGLVCQVKKLSVTLLASEETNRGQIKIGTLHCLQPSAKPGKAIFVQNLSQPIIYLLLNINILFLCVRTYRVRANL